MPDREPESGTREKKIILNRQQNQTYQQSKIIRDSDTEVDSTEMAS